MSKAGAKLKDPNLTKYQITKLKWQDYNNVIFFYLITIYNKISHLSRGKGKQTSHSQSIGLFVKNPTMAIGQLVFTWFIFVQSTII